MKTWGRILAPAVRCCCRRVRGGVSVLRKKPGLHPVPYTVQSMASVSQPRKGSALSTFVAEVRRRLAVKGMTITELADEAEVGRPYLHRVLAGEHTPTIEWMERVGKILGISIKVTVK